MRLIVILHLTDMEGVGSILSAKKGSAFSITGKLKCDPAMNEMPPGAIMPNRRGACECHVVNL